MTVQSPSPAPRVSVVLATWNWSSALACSIPSVLAQTCRDFELLVIGDGCTDDSAAVVASFGDSRIRWHNLPARTGSQAEPNNAGVAMARAPLIAYLGHDDLWHPDHLASLAEVVERSGADLAWSATVFYGSRESGIRAVTGLSPIVAEVPPRFVPPSSWMHRRELLARIGEWRDYRTLDMPHDRELLLRAWSNGARFAATRDLTVFKFPAAWRRDSYVERRTDEQCDVLARLADPRCRERELLAALAAEAAGKLIDVGAPVTGPNGALVEVSKAFKGAAEPLGTEKRTTHLCYEFDRPLPGFEWHGSERHPDWGTYQWSGPATTSTLHLPLANDRDLALELRTLAPLVPETAASLRLEVNGEPVAMEREPAVDGTTTFRARLPAAALARSAGPVRLLFHVAATVRPCDLDPSSQDRRALGLAFNRLEVAPADADEAEAAAPQAL